MRKRKDVYILIRVYFGRYEFDKDKESIVENEEFDSEKFYSDLERAITSVKKNKSSYKGRIIVVINDDTRKGREYDAHINRVKKEILEKHGFCESKGNLCYKCSCGKGSSMATLSVREAFIEESSNDDDIAITLDQDDELFPDAVRQIARKMPEGGMTVSQFMIINSNNLDITNDKGRQHNELVRKKAILNTLPYFECYYASTLGWTKSYTRKLLDDYVKTLKHFLDNERGGTESFFKHHRAYEDFLDFYVFLLPNLKIGWVDIETHVYYKHEDSITSKPTLEAFQNYRTASLLALVDLAYSKRNDLRKDFERDLLRFLTVKMIQIESILKKYRYEYEHGNNSLSVFSVKTHEGYFVNWFSGLATGVNCGSQENELFKNVINARSEKTNANITELVSIANDIPEYDLKLTVFDLGYVLRKCIDAESALGRVKYEVETTDENLYEKLDKSLTPTQRRYSFMCYLVCIAIMIVVLPIIIFFYAPLSSISERIGLVGVLIPLLVAILSFSLNEKSKLETKMSEEINQKKLYYSEFDDLIRHLENNFRVLAQLRRDIREGKAPEPIHFDNLCWPASSCLFSDDMAKIIGRDKVDDFSRLKVNLRNINNSAHWLKEAFKDKTLSLKEQKAFLDWELSRYVGYLMNLYYMKDNSSFSFPSPWQLDEYMEGSSLCNRLSVLFMYESDGNKRLKLADTYIKKYLNDRREKRSVIIR